LLREIVVPTAAREGVSEPEKQPVSPVKPTLNRARRKKRERLPSTTQLERQARRTKWEARFAEVKTLQAEGLKPIEIVRRTGLSRLTVRKYLRLETLPQKRGPKPPHARVANPYREYIVERLQAADPPSTTELFHELQAKGFEHSRSLVYSWVVQLRDELGIATPAQQRQAITQKLSRLTARSLATLILMDDGKRSEEQQQLIDTATAKHTDIATIATLAETFATSMRQRLEERLPEWIESAKASQLPFLQGFASGLQRDYAAVHAAFCSEYSNGQTEGFVNKLKTLKRQMYGRAKFDLLRKRLLYQPEDVLLHGKCG
jgi:transposase